MARKKKVEKQENIPENWEVTRHTHQTIKLRGPEVKDRYYDSTYRPELTLAVDQGKVTVRSGLGLLVGERTAIPTSVLKEAVDQIEEEK